MENSGCSKESVRKLWRDAEKGTKNVQTASNTLYDVMGKRTRAIQQKLKSVKTLSSNETSLILQ